MRLIKTKKNKKKKQTDFYTPYIHIHTPVFANKLITF